MYFGNMADPYKLFQFRIPDGKGGFNSVELSTAQLMKIDQSGYIESQNALRSILSSLETAGIISTVNPWSQPGTQTLPVEYQHLSEPDKLLTEYPFRNDVYRHDSARKVEGVAVPRNVVPVWVTQKVFDRASFSDEALTSVMTDILTHIRLMHGAANANAMCSPSVSIAVNRLGYTDRLFRNLDETAKSPFVPKSARGVPEMDQLRGAWADNRFFQYSDKNAYLPNLGAAGRTLIPDILRNGENGARGTRYVNPAFPEFLRPIHFARFADSGSEPTAGFVITGLSDRIYRLSILNRRPVYTFSDVAVTDGVSIVAPIERAEAFIAGERLDSFSVDSFSARGASESDARIIAANMIERRLRDWYLAYKTSCDIRIADAVTDFATLVQLARFIAYVPPHVLLHSVMGFHNALLRLSFEYVGVPFSTSLTEYQAKMRMEREAIAGLAANRDIVGDSREPGFALAVKPGGLVAIESAELQSATVASLQLAISTAVANPVLGVVCIALAGLTVLIAEIFGGRTQPLIIARDRSREDIRDKRDAGIRSNWFRGHTPEMVVNMSPVVRV